MQVNGAQLRVVGLGRQSLRFLGNRSSADTIRADLMTCHSVVDIIDNVLLP